MKFYICAHPRIDIEFTRQLADRLKQDGDTVWSPTLSRQGVDFMTEVRGHLAGSVWMILVLSKECLRDRSCQQQYREVLNNPMRYSDLRIITVKRFENYSKKDLPKKLHTIDPVDFTHFEDGYQQLTARVFQAMDAQPYWTSRIGEASAWYESEHQVPGEKKVPQHRPRSRELKISPAMSAIIVAVISGLCTVAAATVPGLLSSILNPLVPSLVPRLALYIPILGTPAQTSTVPPVTPFPAGATANIFQPTNAPSPTVTLAAPRMIAFVSTRESGHQNIWLTDIDGADPKRVTITNSGDSNSPKWFPDGQTIAYISWESGSPSLFTTTPSGSGNTPLGSGDVLSLSFSPSGDPIAVTTQVNNQRDITLLNRFGTSRGSITPNSSRDYDPAWSPDGKHIAFVSERQGNADIFVMDASGSIVLPLTSTTARDTTPTWSPNSLQIAFVSSRDNNDEIYVMNATGSQQQRLTSDGSIDQDPAWSPDGSMIAFASNRSGNFDIWLLRLSDGQLIQLTTDPADDTQPAWQP